MTKKRVKRTFSPEFKIETIELAKKIGNSKAASELGISESAVRTWRKKLEGVPQASGLGDKKKSYDQLQKENRKLQKENGYLKEINRVLKKSTAIFSADHMAGLK